MLVMCLLHRKARWLKRRRRVLLAAFLSSIPYFVGLNKREQSLFKLLLYPLCFRALFSDLIQKGIAKHRHFDIFVYFVVCGFYGFVYGTEVYSHNPAMYRMVNNYG